MDIGDWHSTRDLNDLYRHIRKLGLETHLAELDANNLLYQIASSRDYDSSASLDKIRANVMWVNSGDDFINPPELGVAPAQAARLAHGRFVLIPASDETHGHGTHTWAAVWQTYLAELLKESEPR